MMAMRITMAIMVEMPTIPIVMTMMMMRMVMMTMMMTVVMMMVMALIAMGVAVVVVVVLLTVLTTIMIMRALVEPESGWQLGPLWLPPGAMVHHVWINQRQSSEHLGVGLSRREVYQNCCKSSFGSMSLFRAFFGQSQPRRIAKERVYLTSDWMSPVVTGGLFLDMSSFIRGSWLCIRSGPGLSNTV